MNEESDNTSFCVANSVSCAAKIEIAISTNSGGSSHSATMRRSFCSWFLA